jgi:hypothetical protein
MAINVHETCETHFVHEKSMACIFATLVHSSIQQYPTLVCTKIAKMIKNTTTHLSYESSKNEKERHLESFENNYFNK